MIVAEQARLGPAAISDNEEWRVYIYYDDHEDPHFHALYSQALSGSLLGTDAREARAPPEY